MPHALTPLLKPQSVAVIGASPDVKKLNGELFHFLVEGKFPGRILPVNPNYKEIHGIACHPTIAAAGKAIDLALVAIPAKAVPGALEECAAAGVKNAVVISSGFAEEGGDSAGLQQRVAEIAKRTGMRVSGPNSEGFYNAMDRVSATFSPTVPRSWTRPAPIAGARRIGIVAQSGGMGFAIFDRGLASRLDFSYVITSGNEVDLSMADFVDYLVDDPDTGVIGLFCEAIRNPALFESAAAKALARGKPIVALKVGQSEAGSRATASHTASIAGWNAAYDAFFAKYGIIATGDVDEAMSACGLLATNATWGTGKRVAIVTPSGGAGALTSDAMERAGFTVPGLDAATQTKLRTRMPSYGSAVNPIDVTAQGNRAGALVDAVQHMLKSDTVDLVVSVHSLASLKPPTFDATAMAKSDGPRKPIASYSYTLASDIGREAMSNAGLLVNTNLSAMASAMQKIVARAAVATPEDLSKRLPAASKVESALAPHQGRALTEWDAKRFLRGFGIEASREELAANADEAVAAAERLGWPVALKIQSEAILHKTEVGGVALGLRNADELRAAWPKVSDAAGRANVSGDRVQGVLVQRMAPAGVELIAGVINDPTFGPIVMVGLGGVAVELFKDVAYRPAPMSPAEAERLLRSLKAAVRFDGFRGSRKLDLAPAAKLVSELSLIAAAGRGVIAEMEMNPVILHADGSGITIADALIRAL